MTSSYLVFLLSGRLFGVALKGALEILPWRRSRAVPLSYSYVEGLMDYRGTIYPVFNISQRIGLGKAGQIGFTAEEAPAAGAGRSILLLEENKVPFGIIVDTVVKMTTLEAPAPVTDSVQGIDVKYVKGIVFDDDHEIVILDFERLLHAG